MIKHLTALIPTLRPASIALLAGTGIYIIYTYLFYLNHTSQPLAPDPNNVGWQYIKLTIFISWLLLILSCVHLSRWQLASKGYELTHSAILRSLLAGLLFCISVTAYDPPNIDLTGYFFINSIAYAMLIYAFFSIVYVERFSVMVGSHVLRLLSLPAFFWVTLAFSFIFFMAYHMSWVLFEHFPWIDDTIVQLVHAKFMLQGHWYGQSQPLPNFFKMTWMINDGKWYSQYPPGHVLLLAIGLALHHAEMVNPFLGACTCIAVWLLAKELYGSHVAKIAVFLTALCTYLIIFSSEYMSNATSLLMGTLFLWGYFRVLNRRGWPYALITGAALGYCFITRPYSAFGIAIPALCYACYLVVIKSRIYLISMAIMAGIFACFVAFQLYYNTVTTGDPLLFGYQQFQSYNDYPLMYNALKNLSSAMIYRNLCLNLQRLNYFNRMLFEWPLPAMALIALLYILRGNRRNERLLFLTIFFMFLSVQFIRNTDIGWGPRLVYEVNGILLIFCAKALSMLPPLLRKLSSKRHSLRFYYGSGIMILASFYIFSFQYNLEILSIRDFYFLYNREGNPQFYKNIMKRIKPPALVFVPANQYKFVSFTNPPSETSPVIFAIDLGKDNQQLMTQYSKRAVYMVSSYNSFPNNPIVQLIR